MRFGITQKLFFIILSCSITVLLASGIASRVSFHQSFIGYLNEQGKERMEMVIPQLALSYKLHGNSWEFLKRDVRTWFSLTRITSPGEVSNRKLSVSDLTGVIHRLALLDINYQFVNGNPDANLDSILQPLIVDGNITGWLAMIPFQQAVSAGDIQFYNQQLENWWLIGFSSVLFAAFIALFIARTFLRRLHHIANATQELATGNLSTRINSSKNDELGVLSNNFNRLAVTLESSERDRREFMADISHELRTPLSVMQAELEAMEDGVRPLNNISIHSLHRQLHQLSQLIDDLHDLAVTDAGVLRYRHESLNLSMVLALSVDSIQLRCEKNDLVLSFFPLPETVIVIGDEIRLQQLFSNLLENALNYTAEGGEIQVSGEVFSSKVVITIDDSAPSVESVHISRLFERFYRIESSRNRKSGGSGLGLAICRSIVTTHNGQISASDSPLGGLRITITLPTV